MLIDDFLAFEYPESIRQQVERFKSLARTAQVFVMDDDVVSIASNACYTTPDSFIKMIKLAKLPYPVVWVERAPSHEREKYNHGEALGINTAFPKRIGYLLEASADGETTSAYLFWTHHGDAENMVHFSLGFSFIIHAEGLQNFNKIINSALQAFPQFSKQVGYYLAQYENIDIEAIKNNPSGCVFKICEKDKDALKEAFKRSQVLVNPAFISLMIAHSESIPDLYKSIINDFAGETNFIISLLALLNCSATNKELVTISPRLQKSRMTRGKLPLIDYHILKIRLSSSQQKYLKGIPKEQRRLHLRRGHFKVRKTGMFWWNPHFAGNKELGFIDKDYAVGT